MARLCECCRQAQAEMVSNSSYKFTKPNQSLLSEPCKCLSSLGECVQFLDDLLDALHLLPLPQHHLARLGAPSLSQTTASTTSVTSVASDDDVLARSPAGAAVLPQQLAGDLGQRPLVLGDEAGVAGVNLLAPPFFEF